MIYHNLIILIFRIKKEINVFCIWRSGKLFSTQQIFVLEIASNLMQIKHFQLIPTNRHQAQASNRWNRADRPGSACVVLKSERRKSNASGPFDGQIESPINEYVQVPA